MKFLTNIKILIFLISSQLFSQNLVPNPSFENTKNCIKYIGRFNDNTKYWSTPTWGTTDLFNSCSKGDTGVPDNFNGKQYSISGENYVGFYLHSENNYREYIQVKLIQELVKNTKYTISFYISLAEKSDFAIKNIDFLLTEKQLNTTISKELSERQLKKQNIINYSFHKINNNRFYDNKNSWVLITMDFQAEGYENYLTIGNFYKNSKTDKKLVSNKNRFNNSYYYIDLVSIKKTEILNKKSIRDRVISEEITLTQKIELNKEYIFKNVVFDFNSTVLSDKAKTEIVSVYEFLIHNNNTSILIAGHTDDVGNLTFNWKLSKERANTVANFFKSLGLDKNRISSIGYGNSKPISTNETEEGRNKNRRVEFIIVKNSNHNK